MTRSLHPLAALAVGVAIGVVLSLFLSRTVKEQVVPRPPETSSGLAPAEPTPSPAVTAPAQRRLPLEGALLDDLQRQVLEELRVFIDWLEENDADGYIGEVGWPGDEHHVGWNRLADVWFREANAAQLWVSTWAAGSFWPPDYPYLAYEIDSDDDDDAVALPNSQAWVMELHLGTADYRRGINVAGAEFGAPGSLDDRTSFSTEQPGTPDEAYRYPDASIFELLAGRGFDSVRLPFRWERLQPTLGAPLEPEELERLSMAVDDAAQAGLDVILDLHNYGGYWLAEDGQGIRHPLGGDVVTFADFSDVWLRLGEEFSGHDGVLAYGLMNEPVGLEPVDGLEPAEVWEHASQHAVDELRASGDDTLIMISGYNWSHAGEWREHHPEAWISDPSDNHRYEAHHYWQGEYADTYGEMLGEAQSTG